MERFAEVPEQYDPHAVEERVAAYWDEVSAYEQAKAHRADGEDYFFVDGPPYTSGAAHMGTTWNKALKDLYIRYLRMRGYDVTDRPGYDMHGLPIETKVEERLGFENKKDIEAFGVEPFIEECKAYAEEMLAAMNEDFQSFGVWMDWEDPYRTVDPEYMEAAWWGFAHAHERGLVEQGKRSITQCPRCETAIAKNEVEFHEVEDPSVYVKFPLTEREGYLVVWTTTPWTFPGNTFVAVGADLTYQQVRAEKDGETEVLYLEETTVEEALKKGRYTDYEVLDEVEGSEMVGWAYEHPLDDEVPEHPAGEGALQVYTADYVEADRTGLVHSAPGHGEEDFERGSELGLEIFCPVGADGVYDERAGRYAGEFVRDANDDIVADLDEKGLLLAAETYVHDYGQCWRCDTGIVQIVTDQWFITVTDVKEELLDNIEESEWYPSWARDNRFRDFVEEAPDWNVSRQRYWGIPIPIWLCEDDDCDHLNVVGTREELAERVHQDVDSETVDLHKPTVDPLTMDCEACGGTAERVPDVFDVWLDSSVATWGTLDFPGEEEAFEELWPADLIMEAHDQTRGWFWSQLGMGTAALGEIPYEQVLMHGHALAEDGRKMSKSIGNTVEPHEAIEENGRDAMRLFLLGQTAQGDDMRFSWDEMADMQRRLNILWNVFRFPLPYMRMDGFSPAENPLEDADLELEDEWVLSRLQATVDEATDRFEAFEQDKALDELLEFVVEDVSRYYVQIVRERMWEEEDTASKRAAYATTYEVLMKTVAMLAPFAPYVTEEIYRHLTGDSRYDTVHMLDWPAPEEHLRRPGLEDEIRIVREVERAGSAARQQAGRSLRWPVKRIIIDANEDRVVNAIKSQKSLIEERLNAREIEVVDVDEDWAELKYSAEADMSSLGPRFGEDAERIMNALNDARVDEDTVEAFEAEVEGKTGMEVELSRADFTSQGDTPEDVYPMGFIANGVAHELYVDATLDEDIESEGYAREVVRRAQEMRKELDLDMDEVVRLDVMVFDDRVAELVSRHEDLIREEVRAAELAEVEDGYAEDWEVEGVEIRLAMTPLPGAAA